MQVYIYTPIVGREQCMGCARTQKPLLPRPMWQGVCAGHACTRLRPYKLKILQGPDSFHWRLESCQCLKWGNAVHTV